MSSGLNVIPDVTLARPGSVLALPEAQVVQQLQVLL